MLSSLLALIAQRSSLIVPYTPSAQVLEMVRPLASKLGLETPLELWGFFVKQCRSYLHIVLCMSPIGGAFRERLRQNPSIINCCTIDWWVLPGYCLPGYF